MKENQYRPLGIMAALSFGAMYILMYAMVNSVDDVYMNINQAYMAALMAAPMVVIELVVMRAMYRNTRANALIITASLVVGIASFLLIRQQTAVADAQFLRSMIPHHSGAILMCREASLQRPELRDLCQTIISSQQQEIAQMTALLRQLQSTQ
jgi:uncharacterized protein (DUF305 family)